MRIVVAAREIRQDCVSWHQNQSNHADQLQTQTIQWTNRNALQLHVAGAKARED